MFQLLVLFIVVVIEKGSSAGHTAPLNYLHQEQWPRLCLTGAAQSPINIRPGSLQLTKNPLWELNRNKFRLENENNANTLKFAVKPDTTVFVPWVGDNGVQVKLDQLHIHWGSSDNLQGSEHTILGTPYAAETHLVTTYTDDEGEEKVLVFARLFKLGRANKQVGAMISASKKQGAERNINKFDLSALYPNLAGSWYQYTGSYTTPGCDEIVYWVVLGDTLSLSHGQLTALRTIHLGDGTGEVLKENWRETQKTNGREATLYLRESS